MKVINLIVMVLFCLSAYGQRPLWAGPPMGKPPCFPPPCVPINIGIIYLAFAGLLLFIYFKKNNK